ncbi:MAG: hypothetical protein ACREPV_07475 [Lysobacter sp.]
MKLAALPVLLTCALVLASCSPPESAAERATSQDEATGGSASAPVQPVTQPWPDGDTPARSTADGLTTGGDGSQIALEELTSAQLGSVDLPGELACSFADAGGATLLLARADVLPDGAVRGVVNNNGYVEMLGNGRAGGFNDLADGITLSGRGLTVVLGRGESVPMDNEATRHSATLKVQRADGAERTWSGTLTCGP